VLNWLTIGAVTLVGVGAGLAGRYVNVSPAWRAVSYLIAALLLVGVSLRFLGAFVFVEVFDPFQISDLLVGLAAGILVPIWAILLARGIGDRAADAGEPPTAAA
jgi:hypothetical protein